MAKRKSAAALFEVIHSDNRFAPRNVSGRGGGWSLGRLFQRRRSGADASAPAIAPVVEAPIDRAPREPFRLPFALPKLGMGLDPDRQVVSFKMTYTAALVSAFAVVLAVALAYVLGKHNAIRPVPALAELTSEELRAGAPQPGVLDIPGGGEVDSTTPRPAMAVAPLPTGNAAKAPLAPPAPAARAAQGARPLGSTLAMNEPKPPATLMVNDSHRQVGLHYVIVQSYPKEEKQLADEACQLLNKNGILCTVETGVAYAPTWYTVVGISGFDRIKNSPLYDQYVEKIQAVGEKFGGTSKFKKFEPRPFKWREPAKQ
jgi:hypothetical protein